MDRAPHYDRRREHIRRQLGGQVSAILVWSCLGKVRYPDEAVARAATSLHLEKGNADRPELWVHHCDHCRGWHTTKRPQPGSPSVVAGDTCKVKR